MAVDVLVLNAGSSTLKASLVREGAACVRLTAEWTGEPAAAGAAAFRVLRLLEPGLAGVGAVAHRLVHGGERVVAPVLVDPALIAEVRRLGRLAPLHNPPAAAVMEAAAAALPSVRHVAVADTAFHAGLPEAGRRYPVPEEWEAWGVRRYGFHGLSVAWAAGRAADLLGTPPGDARLVVAHLGAGCSVTAVEGGAAAWTSMGMTPAEGLMMATRSGSVDPGMLLVLLREGRLTPERMEEDLTRRSGLAGVSGASGDVRVLLARERDGDPRAALALEMFTRRAAEAIAAAATALTRLDAVVFTGGIGENSGEIRRRVAARLGVLGVPSLDGPEQAGGDRVAARGPAGVAVLVVEAREDLVAAREASAAWPADAPGVPT